jgi:membrane protease YdiL (CAAX protease family)
MRHLESSFEGNNKWWRYLAMLAVIFAAANTIGAVPLLISISLKSVNNPDIADKLARAPNDLSVLNLNPNLYLAEMVFPYLIGLIAFFYLLKPLNGKSFLHVINGRDSFRWNRAAVSAAIWLIFAAIYLFVSLRLDPSNFSGPNVTGMIVPLIIISVLLIPFQAALEEIIFRGYMMQGFTVLFRNRWAPLIFTSLFFALMHIINPEVKEYGFWRMMPQYLLFGFIFGIMTIMDDGVEAAIGAHAANNIFLAVMLTSKSSVLQTPAVYEQYRYNPGTEFLMVLAMGALILLLMKFLFRWKSPLLLVSGVISGQEEIQTP